MKMDVHPDAPTYIDSFLIKLGVSFIASVWTPMPFAIQVLCIVSLGELFTGLFNPTNRLFLNLKRISLSIILTLCVCSLIDTAKMRAGINIGFDMCSAVAMFYILGSSIKITQNLSMAGVNIPPVLLDFMEKAEGMTGSRLNAHHREQVATLKAQQKVASDKAKDDVAALKTEQKAVNDKNEVEIQDLKQEAKDRQGNLLVVVQSEDCDDPNDEGF